MRLAAFGALRYDPDVAGPPQETSAPPYDVFDVLSYTHHRTTNPYTVLELIAGDSTPGVDSFDMSRATLDRWERTGVLRQDQVPALYLYEQHELRHGVPRLQRGIVATIDLADVDDGHLLLHEDVDAARARRRADRMRRVPIDLTPVVAVHVGGTTPAVTERVERARRRPPVVAFTDELNIDHRIWAMTDPADIAVVTEAFAPVVGVLADGHHRVAAARTIRDDLRAADEEPGRWGCLTVMVVDAQAHGPELRAVHRLVPGVPPMDVDGIPHLSGFTALPWGQGVQAMAAALGEMPGLMVGLVSPEGSWMLRAVDEADMRRRAAPMDPTLQALDAQVATTLVAPQISPNAGPEPVFDLDDAVRRVTTGTHASVLVLRPPSAAQVLEVAAAGSRMPAKTTWFRPKPRAGLLMRRLDRAGL